MGPREPVRMFCYPLMGANCSPLIGVPPAEFAQPVVCGLLMETSRVPLFGVTLAGSRFHGRVCTPGRLRRREAVLRETPPTPSGRPTSLRRQRSRQERRLRRTGRLLKLRLISRLPCAAHNRRPAQNSRAAPAQTAAPDFPACCSAAQRFGRGFSESPRVSVRACVISGKGKG